MYVILLVISQEHSMFMERNTSLFEQQVVEAVKSVPRPGTGWRLLPGGETQQPGEDKQATTAAFLSFPGSYRRSTGGGTSLIVLNTHKTSNKSRPLLVPHVSYHLLIKNKNCGCCRPVRWREFSGSVSDDDSAQTRTLSPGRHGDECSATILVFDQRMM